jgi:ribosomal protein L11 methyltransferase
MRWAEILIEIPAESSEATTAILLDAGCPGTAETGDDPRVIRAFLPVLDDLEPRLEAIEDRLAELPAFGLSAPLEMTLKYADEADWANEWRKHFKPMEIGKRLVIKPTWEVYEGDPSRVVVELDPGMAFGTGSHPTTRLCLEILEELVRPGDVVADIGTGSGILALAAGRLGAARVHATDIDSLPRKIARQNVEANRLEDIVLVHEMEDFDAAARDCDIVVANIIASTILDLLPTIAPRLKPGAAFIGSGIVAERLDEVAARIAEVGLELVEVREFEVWRLVRALRPAQSHSAPSSAKG